MEEFTLLRSSCTAGETHMGAYSEPHAPPAAHSRETFPIDTPGKEKNQSE